MHLLCGETLTNMNQNNLQTQISKTTILRLTAGNELQE